MKTRDQDQLPSGRATSTYLEQGRWIVVTLCVVLVVSCVLYGGVDSGTLGILSILSAAIILQWVGISIARGELFFNPSSLHLPLLALGLIGMVQLLPFGHAVEGDLLNVPASAALSLDPYATRFFLMRLVLYLIFFAAALTFLNSEKRLKTFVVFVISFGAIVAFFGILQRLENPDAIYGLRATPQAIPFGPYVNQHHFAAFMEMTGGLAVGLLFGGGFDRYRRLFLLLAAAVMGIAVVFTGSRGGVLSFSGMIAFVILGSMLSTRRVGRESVQGAAKTQMGLAAGGLGLIVLIVGLVLFLGGGESLLRGTGLQSGAGDLTSGRSHFWQIAWKVFLDNPLIGAGFDAFGVAFTKYDTANGSFRVEQAHNDYLQILSDAGILGFACVAAFIYLLFSRSIRMIGRAGSPFTRSAAIGALAGSFGILVHSFFDFPLRTPANSYFFLTIAAIATVDVAGERSRRRKSRPTDQ